VPLVEDESKKAVIRQIFGDQIHPIVLDFMLLLVDKRRIMFLDDICIAFQGLLRQLKQIALAEITSAIALNDDQEEAIKAKVRAMTGAQSVELAVWSNPN
jgi:F-type H+-transporting ATPase subunit delta